ncbi:hypothetical protein KBY70_13565, partial [Cyanobium sp. ATX 6E8]|uniref:hypothetical protein n=1 Tax=Cyanobium sp. ATX 6E8 TaxID=2823701 RepID=UPI0020CDC2C2
VFSLRMICSAVCLVRFMVKSPAQSGRLRTLIHPGPIAGVHVTAGFEKLAQHLVPELLDHQHHITTPNRSVLRNGRHWLRGMR